MALANKRKFIGDSTAYIHLVNDYVIDNYDAQNLSFRRGACVFSHPDMVQRRYMVVDGTYAEGGRATISVDYRGVTAPYVNGLYCDCNVELSNIDFKVVPDELALSDYGNTGD